MSESIDVRELLGEDLLKVLHAGYSFLLEMPLDLYLISQPQQTIQYHGLGIKSPFCSDFCKNIKSVKDGFCQLSAHQTIQSFLSFSNYRPTWNKCWAGISNFMVPVFFNNVVVAVLHGGQILFDDSGAQPHFPENIIDKLTKEQFDEIHRKLQAAPKLSHGDASFVLERVMAIGKQFGELLVNFDKKESMPSLTEYLKSARLKNVLVLGKDTGEHVELLRKVSKVLTDLGYHPVLVKDMQDIAEISNEDKVRSIADASRFVILENTYPAGQIAECKIMSTNRIITACLRAEGHGSSFMVTDYCCDFNFMKEFLYKESNEDSLKSSIKDATNWAEDQIKYRKAYFDSRYPWRT